MMLPWVLRHRRLVLLGWGAVIALAGVSAVRIHSVLKGGSDGIPGSDSVRTIERAVGAGIPAGTFFQFLVVVKSDEPVALGPRLRTAAERLTAALETVPGGGSVRSYWNTGRRDLVGKDGRSVLIVFRPNVRAFSEAEVKTADVRAAVGRVELPQGIRPFVTGTAAMYYDLNRQSSADLLRAEQIGLPVTLAILLVVFGAPVAAGLPLLLALAAVTVSSAGLFFLSQVTTVSVFSENVVSMIGLGVGVDYALFIVSSFRRALAEGRDVNAAAAAALEEAGHTVVVSGAAVAIGFSALFLVNVPFLRSMAFGGILVVVTASAATLTLLPVVLSYLGRAVNWPRSRDIVTRGGSAFWARWAEVVMRRPWTFLIASVAILAVFVAPVLRLRPWNIGAQDLVPELEARQGYEELARGFEQGWMGPTVLLVDAPAGQSVWDAGFQRSVVTLAARLSRDPRIARVTGFSDVAAANLPATLRGTARDVVSADGRMALIVLLPSRPPESAESIALVRDLRRDGWPELGGARARVGISGTAALTEDFDREVFGKMWVVVPAVLGLTFVVLLIAFRSVLIPVKAIALNLVSVLASYGFLTILFQDGRGARWIGLVPPGGLNSFIVLVLFTILFGLSMDYEVFLLQRIKDEYARTGDNAGAVSRGLTDTAGIISSAAVIMVSIFTAFGFTRLVATREFGLGLAFAVALDATLMRLVLVPALMVLFGSVNWWLLRPGRPPPPPPPPARARSSTKRRPPRPPPSFFPPRPPTLSPPFSSESPFSSFSSPPRSPSLARGACRRRNRCSASGPARTTSSRPTISRSTTSRKSRPAANT